MTDELYNKYIEAVRLVYICIRQPFEDLFIDTTWVELFLDKDERWRLESWLEAHEELHFDIDIRVLDTNKKRDDTNYYGSGITLKDRDGEIFVQINDDLVTLCTANIWKALFAGYITFKK